jgi:hypothetical protein
LSGFDVSVTDLAQFNFIKAKDFFGKKTTAEQKMKYFKKIHHIINTLLQERATNNTLKEQLAATVANYQTLLLRFDRMEAENRKGELQGRIAELERKLRDNKVVSTPALTLPSPYPHPTLTLPTVQAETMSASKMVYFDQKKLASINAAHPAGDVDAIWALKDFVKALNEDGLAASPPKLARSDTMTDLVPIETPSAKQLFKPEEDDASEEDGSDDDDDEEMVNFGEDYTEAETFEPEFLYKAQP